MIRCVKNHPDHPLLWCWEVNEVSLILGDLSSLANFPSMSTVCNSGDMSVSAHLFHLSPLFFGLLPPLPPLVPLPVPGEGNWWISEAVNTSQSFHVIDGLQPGAVYTVRLVAKGLFDNASIFEDVIQTRVKGERRDEGGSPFAVDNGNAIPPSTAKPGGTRPTDGRVVQPCVRVCCPSLGVAR